MITVIAAGAFTKALKLYNRISLIPHVIITVFFVIIAICVIEKYKKTKIVKTCNNCGIAVKGKYCPNCGEIIVRDSKEKNKRIVKDSLRLVLIIYILGIISNIVLVTIDYCLVHLEGLKTRNTVELSDADVGDIVEFGKYEQDGKIENGPENIQWYVVKKGTNDNGEDMFLLLSKYILARRAYNYPDDDVIWEYCTLRDWLNDDFYREAFNDEEQNRIVLTSNKSYYYETNDHYEITLTKDFSLTDDHIFLLSIEEFKGIKKNIKDGFARTVLMSYSTEHVMDDDERILCILPWYFSFEHIHLFIEGEEPRIFKHGSGPWWLRSNANYGDGKIACAVDYYNPSTEVELDSGVGVRPAMWVYVK